MSQTLDFSSWKHIEFIKVCELLDAFKNKKYSTLFDALFNLDTMKISFNDRSGYVFMHDDEGHCAMLLEDDIIHLVDENGENNETEK